MGGGLTPSGPWTTSIVADFLCHLCDISTRPKSTIGSAMSSLSCMYEAYGLPNVCRNRDIVRLSKALIKSDTITARKPTPIIPDEAFHNLFGRWPENNDLDSSDLRLNCIMLLALIFMLRPMDVASKGITFDNESMHSKYI